LLKTDEPKDGHYTQKDTQIIVMLFPALQDDFDSNGNLEHGGRNHDFAIIENPKHGYNYRLAPAKQEMCMEH
jgi:hypothetical protein